MSNLFKTLLGVAGGLISGGSWIMYLIVALLSSGLVGAATYKITDWRTDASIAQAHTATQHVQQEYDAYKVQIALDVAKENSDAYQTEQTLQSKLSLLESQEIETQIQEKATSNKLLKDLQNAKQTSCSTLDPGVTEYVNSLRDAQANGPSTGSTN